MFDFLLSGWHVFRTAPHRTAPHRTAPHRTAPHRTAPHPLFYHSDQSFRAFAPVLSFILRKISVPLYFVGFLLMFASPARAGPLYDILS
ncbi:hypothetical protein WDW89_08415 [Deltaproteobacteria bacterium TL4]